jgi:hypothetical protein
MRAFSGPRSTLASLPVIASRQKAGIVIRCGRQSRSRPRPQSRWYGPQPARADFSALHGLWCANPPRLGARQCWRAAVPFRQLLVDRQIRRRALPARRLTPRPARRVIRGDKCGRPIERARRTIRTAGRQSRHRLAALVGANIAPSRDHGQHIDGSLSLDSRVG